MKELPVWELGPVIEMSHYRFGLDSFLDKDS